VFEQLEDLREKPRISPKQVALAILYVFIFGVMVGILIGELIVRRRWNWGASGQVFLMGVLLWRMIIPIFREIRVRLKEQHAH
jgi:F0F1-type ATP synthase assembly protein I